MAGGVALNCVMNAVLRDKGPFQNLWVQPAAGDAGTALGAALWIDAQSRGEWGDDQRLYCMDHTFLGRAYSDKAIAQFLPWTKLPYKSVPYVAEPLADLLIHS